MTSLAPSLAPPPPMPPASYFEPTMKPVMFCRKRSGMPRWQHSSMKLGAFERAFREDHAIIGDDADRHALNARKAAHQRFPVERP